MLYWFYPGPDLLPADHEHGHAGPGPRLRVPVPSVAPHGADGVSRRAGSSRSTRWSSSNRLPLVIGLLFAALAARSIAGGRNLPRTGGSPRRAWSWSPSSRPRRRSTPSPASTSCRRSARPPRMPGRSTSRPDVRTPTGCGANLVEFFFGIGVCQAFLFAGVLSLTFRRHVADWHAVPRARRGPAGDRRHRHQPGGSHPALDLPRRVLPDSGGPCLRDPARPDRHLRRRRPARSSRPRSGRP